MRNIRWWLGQKIFHLAFRVMPIGERAVAMRLISLGTEQIRKEMEIDS